METRLKLEKLFELASSRKQKARIKIQSVKCINEIFTAGRLFYNVSQCFSFLCEIFIKIFLLISLGYVKSLFSRVAIVEQKVFKVFLSFNGSEN